MKKREKFCFRCSKEATVMYRVQFQSDRKWHFLCRTCVEQIKPKNPLYRYGGTWKK